MWKVEKPMSAGEFKERVGIQMCQYSLSHSNYPGDVDVRSTTQKPKKRRGTERDRLERDEGNTLRVSYAMYLDVKFPRGTDTALCSENFKLLKEN